MKKILFCTLALQLISAFNLYSQSGWVWQNPLPQGNNLYEIKMFPSGIGYCRSNYNILKTTNYGINWSIIHNDNSIQNIFFINETTGYYSAGKFYTSSILYKTEDGCLNWHLVNAFADKFIFEMRWLNKSTGFAVQNDTRAFFIAKTTNSGYNWSPILYDTNIRIESYSFPTHTTGYLAIRKSYSLKEYRILKTSNGGESWDSLEVQGLKKLLSVYFVNELSGYISGPRINLGPCLLRTTNGGVSWDSVYYNANPYLFFSKMSFINFNTGYSGGIYKTTNAGASWLLLDPYTETHQGPSGFSVYDDRDVYICGQNGSLGKSTNGGLNWISNYSGFKAKINDITFFDENTGLAIGGYNTGVVLRTTNSGNQWDTTKIDSNELNDIYLSKNNIVYIAGRGKIFKSTDMGLNFIKYVTWNAAWTEVCFTDENTGYVLSKEYRVVEKTTNGGVSWVNILQENGFTNYSSICFFNALNGFIGGERILKTTNGGLIWDTVITNIKPYHFTNKLTYSYNTLYSAGEVLENTKHPIIAFSSDLGNTWTYSIFPEEYGIYDISIPTPNIKFLLGKQHIYKSVDNSPWIRYNLYTELGLKSSINFVNSNTGFISTYSGGILKTTNGGESTPFNPALEIPTRFYLFQNYPNPFNPTTTIRYGLPNKVFVKLKIYDILGRLVKELYNGEQEAGNHSIIFDGSAYASGVYFCTLETPEFTQSQKMVLLK